MLKWLSCILQFTKSNFAFALHFAEMFLWTKLKNSVWANYMGGPHGQKSVWPWPTRFRRLCSTYLGPKYVKSPQFLHFALPYASLYLMNWSQTPNLMYILNVQVAAYGRQTVPDRGVVRSCDPLPNFGASIQSYHWNGWTWSRRILYTSRLYQFYATGWHISMITNKRALL